MTDAENYCERARDEIERFLDDESADWAAFRAHLSDCADCARELALARRVRDGLADLPLMEAPPLAVHRVLTEVREEAARTERASGGLRWLTAPARLALVVMGALALALALVIFRSQAPQEETQLALDDPAVVRATLETKLALAHFARASRHVGRGLGDDVLRDRVVNPISRSVAERLTPVDDGSEAHERG